MSLNSTKKRKLCLKCQACCKLLYIPTRRPNASELEFWKARGCRFVTLRGIFCIAIEAPCPQLSPQGCKIYDNRPEDCKDYDGRRDPLLNKICLWKEENQRRLK